jgi:hypothetical protein
MTIEFEEKSMPSFIKLLPVWAVVLFSSSAFAGEVSRALFTIGIDNREPVILVDSIDSGSYTSISFFTELTELTGHNVTHQWTHNDNIMFEKTFEVKGPRWRVWTSKTLIPSWTGSWTVNVLDDDRAVLASRSFEYQ